MGTNPDAPSGVSPLAENSSVTRLSVRRISWDYKAIAVSWWFDRTQSFSSLPFSYHMVRQIGGSFEVIPLHIRLDFNRINPTGWSNGMTLH